MTVTTYFHRSARIVSGLAATLTLAACPDEGIVDPFNSSATGGSSTGAPDDDGGPSPVTTATPDDGGTSTDGGDDAVGPDSTVGDGTSTGGDESTTAMISGGSSSTGESMDESSSGSSSGGEESSSSSDGGSMATLCPVAEIAELPFTYSDSITGEADEYGSPCGGIGAPDHAYTLVAPADGFYVFDTFGSSFDTVLYVLDGDCGGSSLGCNDDVTGTQSEVSVQLVEGQTVTVVVDSFGLAGGNYTLNGTFFGGSCPDGDIGNTVPQTVNGDTSDDGDNTTEGSCGGGIGFDDSYTFTAPTDGVFVFDTEGSSYDTVLYAFDGDCNGTEIGCNDDISGATDASRIYATMSSGEQIVLVVDAMGAASGAWQLNVDQHACPAEDLGNTAPQSTGGVTTGLPNVYSSTCGGSGSEIGLLFTAPTDATYIIDTFGSNFDTVLSVLDGPGCAGTQLACNDQTGGNQSQVVVDLVAGQQVSIMVDGYFSTSAGNYTLNIVAFENMCPSADLGTTVPQSYAGSTAGLLNLYDSTCNGGAGFDTGLLFTAPATGAYTIDTNGSSFDTVLSVVDGATCGGAELGCDDDSGDGTQSLLVVNLTAGQQVSIMVDGYFNYSWGNYVLNIN